MTTIRITHDRETGRIIVVSVAWSDGLSVRTEELVPGEVMLDYGEDGKPVSLSLLGPVEVINVRTE